MKDQPVRQFHTICIIHGLSDRYKIMPFSFDTLYQKNRKKPDFGTELDHAMVKS